MSSTTNLITVPGDDDVQLQDLLNWALTISWCSRAIVDVFYDDTISEQPDPGLNYLVLDGGNLTTPVDPDSSTDYWYYTKMFPLVSGIETITKATFVMDATTYGLATITGETTVNSGLNWYTWYDTGEIGSGTEYPSGFLNRSALEKTAPTDFVAGQEAQIRIKITTDANGFGGHVNYVAFLTDPDLFKS
jgi:hypothetical protein